MITLVDIAVMIAATVGITQWFFNDHRVQDWLGPLQSRPDDELGRVGRFFKDLSSCRFCLSHWAAIIAIVLWLQPLVLLKAVPLLFAVRAVAGLLMGISDRIAERKTAG